MALQCPIGFPEEYWLPVIAAEAAARSVLLKKLEQGGSAVIEVAVTDYVAAVVGTFAEQGCAAVRANRFRLAHLDATVELFTEHALHHAYWGLNNRTIQGHWFDWNYGRFNLHVGRRVKSAPWHSRYLEEVPQLLNAVTSALDAPAAPQKTPEADNKAKARQAVVGPLLEAKGLSPARWAELAGFDSSVVYDYLSGASNPRPDTRAALAKVLGLRVADLPR